MNAIIFLDVVATSTDKGCKKNTNTVDLAESLSFFKADTNLAFIAKSTYEIGITFGKSDKEMNSAVISLIPELMQPHTLCTYPTGMREMCKEGFITKISNCTKPAASIRWPHQATPTFRSPVYTIFGSA